MRPGRFRRTWERVEEVLQALIPVEETMNAESVFCPTCEKQVHVTLTPATVHGDQPVTGDTSQLVCLTFGPRCAAGRCPIAGLPSIVMGVRLAKSGLEAEEGWKTLQMRCQGCDQITEMDVLDNTHAYCTACGTTNTWFTLDMGEDAIAATLPRG
jgi:hypothetical protein